MGMTRSARVGLTTLAALVCAGGLAAFLGHLRLSRGGYPLTVVFGYVDSLKTAAPVLYGGGVDIGSVRAIELRDGQVAVVLDVRNGVRIPADSVVGIHTAGVLGEKYVEVAAGHASAGFLAPGAVVRGEDPGSLDRALRKVEALADAVEPLLRDPRTRGGVVHALRSLDKASDDLDAMVEENRADLRASVRNLRGLTADLDATAAQARPLVGRAARLLSEADITRMQDGIDRMDASLTKLDAMMAQIQSGKGALGMLVYDDRVGDDLRDLLEDLKTHPWKLLWKK